MTRARPKSKDLAAGEVEITWPNGMIEVIKTEGLAYNAGAIVLQIGPDKVIIPMTSVRRFRVRGA